MEHTEEYMRDYLLGKLTPEETQRMEQELEDNPDLMESLDLQRDIMIGIQAGFDEELRKKLIQSDLIEEGKIRSLSPRILWQWASVAAIVLGSLGVYYYLSQTSVEERIYLTYFEDFPNIVDPVQRDTPGQSEGFIAYQNGQYQEALEIFSEMEQEDPTAIYTTFYKGICAMHLEDWSLAIQAFEKVRSAGDQRFVEAATWYVSLAYLRSGNRDRATLILESITEAPGNFRTEARAILDQLD